MLMEILEGIQERLFLDNIFKVWIKTQFLY